MRFHDLKDKLICDGGDRTRLRVNLLGMAIGSSLLLASAGCAAFAIRLERYTGEESLALLLPAALFAVCGILALAIIGVKTTCVLLQSQRKPIRRRYLAATVGCIAMVSAYAAAILFLLAAGTGRAILPLAIGCAAAAGLLLLAALALQISAGRDSWQ